METEEVFLVFACLMLFFDLIQLLKIKAREKNKLEYGFYAITLACGLIIAAYVMFVQAFLTDNFSFREVYSYSSSGLPLLYKFYATWGGAGGSMIFLTSLTCLIYFFYRFRTNEKGKLFDITAYRIIDLILIFFIIVTLMDSPFERISITPMDGRGLNPLLQTFWMLVHPPIVFLGYVLILFAFVFALASMSTESKKPETFKLFVQAAWLIMSLGIAIGGLWAYEVLGWGGYWAWDPVETASLLPWLALTAYFHLGKSSSENLTGEFMILMSFITVVFATALTRGGLLVSVHAFGASPVGPMLFLLALIMVVYFFYLKSKSNKPLYTAHVEKSSLLSISLFIAFWSLVFLLLVCFFGVAFPMVLGFFRENPQSLSVEFYNNWCYPFTLAFIAGLIGCHIPNKFGLKKFLILVLSMLALGALLVIIKYPTPNFLANFGFPLLFLALGVIGYRFASYLLKIRKSAKLFGRAFLHLAIIILLIGVFASSTTKLASGNILAKPNSTVETLGLKIHLGNFTIYNGTGRIHLYEGRIAEGTCYPEYSAIKLDITIEYEGNVYEESLWIKRYTAYGIACMPTIISTWKGDLYIHMHHTDSINNALLHALFGQAVQPTDLIIAVEIIPMIYLVWAGIAMLTAGMSIVFVNELIKQTLKKVAKK